MLPGIYFRPNLDLLCSVAYMSNFFLTSLNMGTTECRDELWSKMAACYLSKRLKIKENWQNLLPCLVLNVNRS